MSRVYPSNGEIYNGKYTPILTGVTNVADATISTGDWLYIKIGNIVNVAGSFYLTTTAAGGFALKASLPIPTNITETGQVSGCAGNILGNASRINGNVITDDMTFNGYSSSASLQHWTFSFTYEIA